MRFFLLISLLAHSALACELGVYTYDSIAGKGGLGPQIFSEFEKRSGCTVHVLTSGDAIQAVGRVEIDLKRGKPAGDVILGVDNLTWGRISAVAQHDTSIDPEMRKRLEPQIQAALPSFPGLIPYDFGALALMADSAQKVIVPKSLRDLTQAEFKKALILEDPRTSSPGLQLVLFTKRIFGTGFKDFWKSLRGQWLAMPAGWDAAYSLFLKGKAPLVWSYVTSEAYHREHGSTQYKAILFNEGQPLQIEGAVVIGNAKNPKTAAKFLKFLLSDYVQERIGATNWMWPVRKDMTVPPSFAQIPKVEKGIVISGSDTEDVLKEWSEAVNE